MNSKDQKSAIEKLSRLKIGALFMEMGTGKTKVALDLIDSRAGKIDMALWICPFSLKGEIQSEKEKWYPDMNLEVVGCESIGQSDRIFMETLELVTDKRAFMVVDESLKIKNIKAKRTQRILRLGEHAAYKLILNGTPVSKNVLDLYTQMEFLSPKILNMSFLEFKDTYCEYDLHGPMAGVVRKTHNIEHLVSKIEPYIFESKLDIDPKQETHNRYYNVDMYEYAEVKHELFDEYYDPNTNELDFLSFATKLQQFYTGKEEHRKSLDSLINDIDGQVIVFVKFLDSIPDGAHSITGDVPASRRDEILHDFESGKFKTLYMTYGCGAFGLNLQFCSNTIFSELVFDYANIVQAEARTYRIGQSNDVNYYWMICSDSGLDDMILNNIGKKGSFLESMKKEIDRIGVMEWVNSI